VRFYVIIPLESDFISVTTFLLKIVLPLLPQRKKE